MGEGIDLGLTDSIDNYEDVPYTEESYKAFYISIGQELPYDWERKFGNSDSDEDVK